MLGNIIPEVIECKLPIYSLFNSKENGALVIISPAGTIHHAILGNNKLTAGESEAAFELPCKEYFQSPDKRMYFGYGGRDFHAADLDLKIAKRLNVTYETNERILTANMISCQDKKILVCVSHDGWNDDDSYYYYLGYDFQENKIVYKIDKFKGGIFYYIKDNSMLFQDWSVNATTKWWITDGTINEIHSNKLTDKLSDMNISTLRNTFSFINNKMIGCFTPLNSLEKFCFVQWKSNFSDPSVHILSFQEPKDRFLYYNHEFSPNGKWVKSTSDAKRPDNNTWIMFYHCDDAYPGGLSIPIHGGDSHSDSKGVFLDTPEHGMVYLDISRGLDGVLYMYKMNDVLTQIAKRAKEMVE